VEPSLLLAGAWRCAHVGTWWLCDAEGRCLLRLSSEERASALCVFQIAARGRPTVQVRQVELPTLRSPPSPCSQALDGLATMATWLNKSVAADRYRSMAAEVTRGFGAGALGYTALSDCRRIIVDLALHALGSFSEQSRSISLQFVGPIPVILTSCGCACNIGAVTGEELPSPSQLATQWISGVLR
jgi:hypothetical protein